MESFRVLDAIAFPMVQSNVDTDQIVPSRFLQKPRSDDFGAYLFRDLRFRADGSPTPQFLLNEPVYSRAKIIVAEQNFGCGSSREHAVWALYDYGFRVAIAPSFGDIFTTNSVKNGLLPIVLPERAVGTMLHRMLRVPGTRIAVDLEAQTVRSPDGTTHEFTIDPFAKHCLLEGLDEIGFTLKQLPLIEAFEVQYADELPKPFLVK